MPTLLVLPNGRVLAHPEAVKRGQVIEHRGKRYRVDAVAAGTKRDTGEDVRMARLNSVG